MILKRYMLVFTVFVAVIVAGCSVAISPESVIKNNPNVKSFLNDYPNSEFVLVYYNVNESEGLTEEYIMNCGKELIPKNMYKFTVSDIDTEFYLIGYFDNDNNIVECIKKHSSQKTSENSKENDDSMKDSDKAEEEKDIGKNKEGVGESESGKNKIEVKYVYPEPESKLDSKYASFRIRTDVEVDCNFELTEKYEDKKTVVEVNPGASKTTTYFSYDYEKVKSGATYIAEFKCYAEGYDELKKEYVYYASYDDGKYSTDFVKIDITGCEDTDGGINYFKKGEIIDNNYDFHENYSTTDYCDTVGSSKPKWLVEYKCVEGYPPTQTIRFECEYGCENGACINKEGGSYSDDGKYEDDKYKEEDKYKDEDNYKDEDYYKDDEEYDDYDKNKDDNMNKVEIKYISPEEGSDINSKYLDFTVKTDEADCEIAVTQIIDEKYENIEHDKDKYSTSTYHIFNIDDLINGAKLKIVLECSASGKEDIRYEYYYHVNYDEADYDSDFVEVDIEGCEDSDGGIDYFSKGVVVDYSYVDEGVISHTVDYCDPVTSNDDDVKDLLIEYSCKDGYPMAKENKFWCVNGCDGGACRDDNGYFEDGFTAECTDSDGDDRSVKGNVIVKIHEIGNIDIQHDRCNGALSDDSVVYYNGVIEYGCSSDNILEYKVLECANGCKNGVCLN